MTARTVAEFRAEYAKADAFYSEVQGFRNQAGIPAMNELRNAGHHLLKSIDDKGGVVSQDDLNSAVNHARRACYEASEAGIVFALAIVAKFQDDYRAAPITDVMSDYVPRIRRCKEAGRLIEAGRQNGFDRDGDHQSRIDVFRELRAFCDDLDIARPEMNKVVSGAKTLRRRFLLQISATLFGIALAATFAIWASTGYQSPWKQQTKQAQ